jgi:hypothetical protein
VATSPPGPGRPRGRPGDGSTPARRSQHSARERADEWGIPPARDTLALLAGVQDANAAAPFFDRCRTLATVDNGVGLNNQEPGLPVLLCRVAGRWPVLWSRLTHYD